MKKKTWPTLFKRTATGATQTWTVWVEDATICTRWGQQDGAMQEGRDTIKEGKNAGRANATTPEEQAIAEAQSRWELKKKKNCYVENADAAQAGEVDELVEGGLSPMLAQDYGKHASKIVWPAYAQPKFDGHRCIAVVKDGKTTLWSRTRKRITGVPHIAAALDELVAADAVFDGELYNHEYKDRFEELTSFIRQVEPKEGHEVVQYHVYDTPDSVHPFSERNRCLAEFFAHVDDDSPLKRVETVKLKSEKELFKYRDLCIDAGFEGAMARNSTGLYVAKRSYDLQKAKLMMDAEFKVVAVNEGRGKMAGLAIFECVTKDGNRFATKMEGELDSLRKYLTNPKLAIGKMLTVRFQGLTNANNVPRFPVAVRFRNDV